MNTKQWLQHLMIAVFTMIAGVAYSQGDAISKYFNKYVDDPRFDMVYISPKMFSMISNIDLNNEGIDPDVADVIKDLKGLRILTYKGPEANNFYNEATSKINLDEYDELLVARGSTENVQIRVKDSGNIVHELLLIVGSTREFTLLSFVGNIDLKKVGKLGSILNIDKLQHLEKIDEKR